ncbi:hypothetical protein MRB53_026633 [Persea americana]|uniref:Uncharacterized protein n=1 Tax=Persea americana TaxID=3435 RepID=A0ACC2LIK5_PERAE|nr:hypothetical protein MRB53_026633 [Persea americana]
MMLRLVFNGLVTRSGGVIGHAQQQEDAAVGVDVVPNRMLAEDEDAEGLPEPTQHKCQDRTLRMLIGAGEQREGLYFLKGVATVRVYKTIGIASFEL